MSPEEREELKTIIREVVAEELEEKLRRDNDAEFKKEMDYWKA